MDLCPACGRREQGESGFCAICDALDSLESYRETAMGEVIDRRDRWRAWIGQARQRDEERAS